jgi:hypothetical protein
MMRQIKESDWRILRQLKSQALELLCKEILLEIEQINADTSRTFHERYLSIYKILRQRDKEIADIFDGFSRSTALIRLAAMKRRGLLTDDEFSRFSQETKEVIALLLGN